MIGRPTLQQIAEAMRATLMRQIETTPEGQAIAAAMPHELAGLVLNIVGNCAMAIDGLLPLEEDADHVSVIVYHHRHGIDIFAHATPEAATKHAADLSVESAHEVPKHASEIREHHAAGRFDECIDAYIDACANGGAPEDFDINTVKVLA